MRVMNFCLAPLAALVVLGGVGERELVPSRVLLSWGDEPATSAVVTWRTEGLPEISKGQIALASHDPRFVKDARGVNGKVSRMRYEDVDAYYSRVRFEGLEPETRYSYRVGDGENWSEWFDFTTASDEAKPFSFVYFGDAQNNVKSMWSRVVRQAAKDAPDADFFLHAGDLINIPNADHEWAEWFYAGGWLHATIPSVAIPGNHEYSRGKLSEFWRPQFDFPDNGVAGLEETCYYFDFQGARIIGMNSLEKTDEQVEWLDKVLTENPQKWTFVTFHYPMWSTAKGRDNVRLREKWLPILLKHDVDLVLQGHDHSYGRKNVPTGASGRKNDTVFVVSVSGPKMYTLGDEAKEEMQKTAEFTQLYQVIRVDGDKLVYQAKTAVGDVYDSFEMVKSGGKKVVRSLSGPEDFWRDRK